MFTPQVFNADITGEMKGRNGYTKLGRVSVCTFQDGRVRIDFCSPRAGAVGAAALALDSEQLTQLVQLLQRVQESL